MRGITTDLARLRDGADHVKNGICDAVTHAGLLRKSHEFHRVVCCHCRMPPMRNGIGRAPLQPASVSAWRPHPRVVGPTRGRRANAPPSATANSPQREPKTRPRRPTRGPYQSAGGSRRSTRLRPSRPGRHGHEAGAAGLRSLLEVACRLSGIDELRRSLQRYFMPAATLSIPTRFRNSPSTRATCTMRSAVVDRGCPKLAASRLRSL